MPDWYEWRPHHLLGAVKNSSTGLARMHFGFRSKDKSKEQTIESDETDKLPQTIARIQPKIQSRKAPPKCPSCGFINRDHAKFCSECATELPSSPTDKPNRQPHLSSENESDEDKTAIGTGTQSSEPEKRDLWETERKEERLKLYRRDDTRRFLGWLLRANEEFIAAKSPVTGEYVYSGTEFGLDDVLPLLNQLQSESILERKVIDTPPACPQCQHTNFYVSFACPFCQNTSLEQGNLLEHYPCGYSDFETHFQSGTDMVCPKCHRFLKVVGTDYRKVTQAYRCVNCAKFFGTPKVQLPCRTCGRLNFEQDMILAPVYKYTITKALKGEVVSNVSLDAKIRTILERNDYKVIMPRKLHGLSGVSHAFDMGAKNEKEKKELVMDMISAVDEVQPQDIVAFFAKVYDTKPPLAILIAMPKISVEAQRLAAMYSLKTIVAEDPSAAVRKLMPILEIDAPMDDFETALQEPASSGTDHQVDKSPFVEQIKKSLERQVSPKSQTSSLTESEESGDKALNMVRERMNRIMAQVGE